MLHDLVTAPPHPGERHHGVRLFIGSGMPLGLWRRVQDRFRPARVLEFYAATEAGAVLANVSGAKPGAMGRPLPGSAEVRVAAYDVEAAQYLMDEHGFAIQCEPGEVGMLLCRVQDGSPSAGTQLRGMFQRGDAWLEIGDLFRRDGDGDLWRVDGITEVIHTRQGAVFTGPIRDALYGLPAVDLAVAFGLAPSGAEREIAVAAVTLREAGELRPRDITAALAVLEPHQRPAIVQVVDEIPVTTWFRPLTGPLRERGLPQPGQGLGAWFLDAERGAYRPLTIAAHRRLAGVA
jgi:putative long chain acyl-CoA synthase